MYMDDAHVCWERAVPLWCWNLWNLWYLDGFIWQVTRWEDWGKRDGTLQRWIFFQRYMYMYSLPYFLSVSVLRPGPSLILLSNLKCNTCDGNVNTSTQCTLHVYVDIESNIEWAYKLVVRSCVVAGTGWKVNPRPRQIPEFKSRYKGVFARMNAVVSSTPLDSRHHPR